MAAKYVLSHQPAKGYHWNLLATNGRVIASSEHYETKRAALAGIASVQKNGATTVIEEAGSEPVKKAIRKGAPASSGGAARSKTASAGRADKKAT